MKLLNIFIACISLVDIKSIYKNKYNQKIYQNYPSLTYIHSLKYIDGTMLCIP